MYNMNEVACVPVMNDCRDKTPSPNPPMYELLGQLNEMTMATLDHAFYIQGNLFGGHNRDDKTEREVCCARDLIYKMIDRMREVNDILVSVREQL